MSRPLEHPGRGWRGLVPISVPSPESPEQVVAFDVYLVGSAPECKVLRRLDFHLRAGAGLVRLCREGAVWCGLCPGLEVGLQSPGLLSVSPSFERSARISLPWERRLDGQPGVTDRLPRRLCHQCCHHTPNRPRQEDMDAEPGGCTWLWTQRSLGTPGVGLLVCLEGIFQGYTLSPDT